MTNYCRTKQRLIENLCEFCSGLDTTCPSYVPMNSQQNKTQGVAVRNSRVTLTAKDVSDCDKPADNYVKPKILPKQYIERIRKYDGGAI